MKKDVLGTCGDRVRGAVTVRFVMLNDGVVLLRSQRAELGSGQEDQECLGLMVNLSGNPEKSEMVILAAPLGSLENDSHVLAGPFAHVGKCR